MDVGNCGTIVPLSVTSPTSYKQSPTLVSVVNGGTEMGGDKSVDL
jgi:hypothetical protein